MVLPSVPGRKGHRWATHGGRVVHGDLGGSPQPCLHHACQLVQLMPRANLKQASASLLVSEAPEEATAARCRGGCSASSLWGGGQDLVAEAQGEMSTWKHPRGERPRFESHPQYL